MSGRIQMQNRTEGHGEWLTPPHILKALGPFDLDPCAPVKRPWPMANHHFTVQDDGFNQDWYGRIWLNPPYGTELPRWLGRLAEHGNGICLAYARTETKMFFDHVWGVADAVLFLEGRLYFHYVDGTRAKQNGGAPSVLIAYGKNNAEALRDCGLPGYCTPLRKK
jgi:hypothetical protein